MKRSSTRLSARALLAIAAASAITLSACVEDPLALDSDSAPGASSSTLDFSLLATEIAGWRDTTYSGFALPTEAGFQLVANTSALRARLLAVLNVPDTVRTFADTLPATSYDSLDLRIAIDTSDSEFGGFPLTVRMVEVTQSFDVDQATWTQAAEGMPWMTPGGDFGDPLASGQLTELADSIVLQFSVDDDSLLKSWRDSDGEPGFALIVEGPESILNIRNLTFRFEALLEGRTVPVEQTQPATRGTFISDPEPPPVSQALRVGGLPASRFYLEFDVPDSLGGIPLEGAVINHAELVFQPFPPPAAPFTLERALAARQVKLLADPFVFGPKTPIGTSPLTFTALEPDSLALGLPLRIDVTLLVLDAIRDDDPMVRLGFRGEPDAQTFGFWEFGSITAPPALQPSLRVILTPPPTFDVPQ